MAILSAPLNSTFFKYRSLNYVYKYYSSSNIKRGLVLGAYCEENKEGITLTETARKFDELSSGRLQEHLSLGSPLKAGKCHVFWSLHKEYNAVAVVGLGSKDAKYNPEEEIDEARENIRCASAVGCRALQSAGMTQVCVEDLGNAGPAAEGAGLAVFSYQDNKLEKSRKTPPNLSLYTECKKHESTWNEGMTLAKSQNLARTLMETPANLMTPTIFAQRVAEDLSPLGVQVIAREKGWAEEKKMMSFLSVSQGSEEPPIFLEISFKNAPDKNEKPVVLVGKGVTFDTGGISLKPSADMAAMRGDMGGAACVVGAIKAVATLNLPVNIVGLIPLTENMPSGKATKPGDVVMAMNGKSILVDNTDAEGRLILADALSYSESFNPQWTVDLATLTGAMRVALGGCAAGAFTKNNSLWEASRKASIISGDRLWRFPLWKHYTKRVTDFPNVDVHNVGKGKGGGSCTAAAFLAEFAPPNVPWMHLDIASVMNETDDQPYLAKGMSGRPTRTLVELIKNNNLV